jgi:hypothetical protein
MPAPISLSDARVEQLKRQRLRHSRISTTLGTYGRLLRGAEERLVKRLDERFRDVMGEG